MWQHGRQRQRAQFYYPGGVAVDSAGNVYVADEFNCTIRKIDTAGNVTTLAGQAGTGGQRGRQRQQAQFYYPIGVAVDSAGNVYVADQVNQTIRKIDTARNVTTLAGSPGDWARGRQRQRGAIQLSLRRGGGQRGQRLCGG